ncbi:MAG TPA: hypothetical protein DCZ88_08405 [Pseudanabaena sp.]|nr:hypothetical protein [Pseudanabaena sp.]
MPNKKGKLQNGFPFLRRHSAIAKVVIFYIAFFKQARHIGFSPQHQRRGEKPVLHQTDKRCKRLNKK